MKFKSSKPRNDNGSGKGGYCTLVILICSLALNIFLSPFPDYVARSMGGGGNKNARSGMKSLQQPLWSEDEIVQFMADNPSRAYFTKLFQKGGFRTGVEVGVAQGRFSELFLEAFQPLTTTAAGGEAVFTWTMVEPFPSNGLAKRYEHKTALGQWHSKGLLNGTKHVFYKKLSNDKKLLKKLPNNFYDFIYLDGDHTYKGVKKEMFNYWPKIREGGVLAGHDYCNYGEKTLPCKGCDKVPRCGPYTEYGLANGKPNVKRVSNENGVVKAVQQWMMAVKDPRLQLRHTKEDFTRESLAKDGMNYDLVITSTRTPSWYIVKPRGKTTKK